jgi:hypothetical protein
MYQQYLERVFGATEQQEAGASAWCRNVVILVAASAATAPAQAASASDSSRSSARGTSPISRSDAARSPKAANSAPATDSSAPTVNASPNPSVSACAAHPAVGRLAFEHAVFRPDDAPDQRLVLNVRLAEHDTPAKLARLLEGIDQPQMVEEAVAV